MLQAYLSITKNMSRPILSHQLRKYAYGPENKTLRYNSRFVPAGGVAPTSSGTYLG